MLWYTYILRCRDGSLYTGITTDLVRRLAQHRDGKASGGAKYTNSRPPEGYECAFVCPDRAASSRLEYRIKQLTRTEKLSLIAGKITISDYVRANIDSEGHLL